MVGASGHRMFGDHARCYGLGTDAVVTICSGNTNVRNGGKNYKPLSPTCTSVESGNIAISYLYLYRYPTKP